MSVWQTGSVNSLDLFQTKRLHSHPTNKKWNSNDLIITLFTSLILIGCLLVAQTELCYVGFEPFYVSSENNFHSSI